MDRPVFYGRHTLSGVTRRFERNRQDAVDHRAIALPRPLAVLIDDAVNRRDSRSSLASAGDHVVGFYGTYGSFGMSGAEVLMPGGLTVDYPNGQSLDANGHVQLDSNWELAGGIIPDVRVPLTMETVRAQFIDGRDVVLEAALKLLK